MYTYRRHAISVRSGTASYGGIPTPSEDFPGAGALQDLTSAPAPEIPMILARYAVLRAWALASERKRESDPAVASHAVSAALAHLAATADDWDEKELLRGALTARLRSRSERPSSLDLLLTAAAAAESIGHRHGGRALRETVHRARWWGGGFWPPCLS